MIVTKGSTNFTLDIFVGDSSSSTGAGLTGLVFNSAGLTCYYRRGATGSATALTLVTLATIGTAHADGGFKEIDATNMPGMYRLDLSDAVLATGVDWVTIHLKGATNMAPVNVRVELADVDLFDAVRGGMTALPNAAADAAGGLPISDGGGLTIDGLAVQSSLASLIATVGVAGQGLNALGGMGTTMKAQIESEANDALVALGLDHLLGVAVTGPDVADNSLFARLVSSAATADWDTFIHATDSLQAIRDQQGTIQGGQSSTDALVTAVSADLLGYVQLLARSDAAINTDGAALLAAINANEGSGAGNYDNQSDAIEALRDRGDLSWLTSTLAATDIVSNGAITTADGAVSLVATTTSNTDMRGTDSAATAAAVAALNNVSVAQIWTTALTEAYRATGATGTGAEILYEILANIINSGFAGTLKTVKKIDKVSVAKTYTLVLDGNNEPVSIEETT